MPIVSLVLAVLLPAVAQAAVAQPTLTITGGGNNPAIGYVGQPLTIAATFTAAAGDALQKTAINDSRSILWCGSGNTCNNSMWEDQPLGTKSYTFVPPSNGQYVFYPAVITNVYNHWNNYDTALVVNVGAACTNGSGLQGSCTSCNSGYVVYGTAPNNSCQLSCPNGQGIAGQCTVCDPGYQMLGGSCVAGGSINQRLVASATRVRKGGPDTLSWSTSGMQTCTLTDESGATLSYALSSSGTPVVVSHPSQYVLTCNDGQNSYTSSVNVTVSPVFQEI